MHYFLQGYSAKVAGTEVGLGKEPEAVFSSCFGAPFMALPPIEYARLFLDNIVQHKVRCWLVNTGLVLGGFNTGGNRISIKHTRALIRAAINGSLLDTPMETEPVFGFLIPTACEGVPKEILKPSEAWEDKDAYNRELKGLAAKFISNFARFTSDIPAGVSEASPKI